MLTNPALQMMMKMFSDNSDDAIVSTAFEISTIGKKIGDSWADTVNTKEMKKIGKLHIESPLPKMKQLFRWT